METANRVDGLIAIKAARYFWDDSATIKIEHARTDDGARSLATRLGNELGTGCRVRSPESGVRGSVAILNFRPFCFFSSFSSLSFNSSFSLFWRYSEKAPVSDTCGCVWSGAQHCCLVFQQNTRKWQVGRFECRMGE